MTTGVVLLNFGEPSEPNHAEVVEYLERIFLANAPIDGDPTDASNRARTLAERRAPDLLAEYEAIGGSPLPAQAHAQADALAAELHARGFDAGTYVGMQFTPPFIEDAVERALADGRDHLIGLPIYPLCGPSTTVAALEEFAAAVATRDAAIRVDEITGWHRHPGYNRLRAENVQSHVEALDSDGLDDTTALVFSAHGTPMHYIEAGSRYVEYVEEYCRTQAALLGIQAYQLGYQNHDNRGVEWTEPEVDQVVHTLEVDHVVVEPVSFMHEQSETLSELDRDLKEQAHSADLRFTRIPVPHDDERFPCVLADLVEPLVADIDPAYYNLYPCSCRQSPNAVCLNAGPNHTHATPEFATSE